MSDRHQPPHSEHPQDRGDGGSEEAFLYAIAKQPSADTPLNEADRAALHAWFAGEATFAEVERGKAAVRRSLSAQQLIMSLQLERAALASPPIPDRVSRAILRRTDHSGRKGIRDWLSLPALGRWQFAGLGAAVAVAVLLSFGLQLDDQGRTRPYRVATLSDRSVLAEPGGSIVRGLTSPSGTTPTVTPAPVTPSFIEVDVANPVLETLLGISQQAPVSPADPAILAAAKLLLPDQGEPLPVMIFDSDLQAFIRSGKAAELVVVRVYDLTNKANLAIARDLKLPPGSRSVFITGAP